jgi:magnesium transporter
VKAEQRLALAFMGDHPEDAARLLERADATDAASLLERIPAPLGARVFRALGPTKAASCAAALNTERLVALIEALPLDVAGGTLRRLEPGRREEVLARLPDERGTQLRAILAYPENTAGTIADPSVFTLAPDIRVTEARRQLRSSHRHVFPYVYVVARDHALVGALALPELMVAHPEQAVAAVMQRNLVYLDARTHLATVALHPAWRDFDALPVVDGGRLIGAVRHRTIRRMSWQAARPMMATLVDLSELYWSGLSGMLSSLVPPRTSPPEEEDVT